MDELLNRPDGSRPIVQVVVGFLGSVGALKFISVLANRVMDRRIKQDEYRHHDSDSFTSQAWKRADELHAECKRLDAALDDKMRELYTLGIELAITKQRLQSEIDQSTRLSSETHTLKARCNELETRLIDRDNAL